MDEISRIISLDFIVTELTQVSISSLTNIGVLWNESFESPEFSSEIKINGYLYYLFLNRSQFDERTFGTTVNAQQETDNSNNYLRWMDNNYIR